MLNERQSSGLAAQTRRWYARVNAVILCAAALLLCAARVAEVQDDDVTVPVIDVVASPLATVAAAYGPLLW
jgi:hypothetical protein